MKKLTALLVLLGATAAACWYWFRPDATQHATANSSSRISGLRIGLEARYRLRPDTRFLLAVTEIHRILAGGATNDEPVQPEFRTGRWTIRHGNKEVGTLNDPPDFAESIQLLSAFAARTIKEKSIQFTRQSGDAAELQSEISKLHTLNAILQADQQWQQGKREVELLRVAGEAMAMLAVQSLDEVETADLIPARALALLAIQRALDPSSVRREECLLAQVMGYSRHAYEQAAQLPEEEPVRTYIRHEDTALAKAAAEGSAIGPAWFLHLKRFSEKRDLKGWQNAARTPTTKDPSVLPLLKTGIELTWFETDVPMALGLVGAVLGEMKQWSKATKARLPGPFFDGRLLETYYRGFLYSALHKLGEHYRESLSSTDATANFDQLIGTGGDLLAIEYRNWFHHLAEAKAGRAKVAELRADLTDLSRFGGTMLFETYAQIKESLPFGDASLKDVVKELATRLDSRPEHRFELAWILYNDLLALTAAESLAEGVAKTQHFGNLGYQAWFARLNGDRSRLETLLALPELTPAESVKILRQLNEESGFTREWLDNRYAQLVRAHPEEWSVADAYVDHLEKHKEFAKAQSVVQSWLDQRVKGVSGFDYTFARTSLARIHRLQGKPERGLAAIEHPDVDSWQFGAMKQRAQLLDSLGRTAQAEQLAQAALDRYPDSINATVLLAELYWKHGKHDGATDLFLRHRYPISATTWRFTVGRRFAEIFKDLPEEALAAEEPLRHSKLDSLFVSTQFALEIYKAGNPQLAFEIQSRQRAPGLKNLLYQAKAYKFLKDAKGKDAALGWLGQQIPDSMRAPLCMFAIEDKTHELLWELAPAKLEGDNGAYYWLARAAAFVLDGGENQEHGRLLNERFANAGPGHYHTIGRYLLGKASEAEVLAEAVDQKKSNEIYYFVGLKAKTEGRYCDAADWFWLTMEMGTMNNGETRWALDQLYVWMGKGKSLKILAEEDRRLRTSTKTAPTPRSAG